MLALTRWFEHCPKPRLKNVCVAASFHASILNTFSNFGLNKYAIPGPAPSKVIARKKNISRITIGNMTVTYIALPADDIPFTQARNTSSHIQMLDTKMGQTILLAPSSPHEAKFNVVR